MCIIADRGCSIDVFPVRVNDGKQFNFDDEPPSSKMVRFLVFLTMTCAALVNCDSIELQRLRKVSPQTCLFQVNGNDISCEIKDGRDHHGACRPDKDCINRFISQPPSISYQKFFNDSMNSAVLVNVTWNQEIPDDVDVVGYIVKLIYIWNPKINKCYFIHFNSSSLINKRQVEFSAQRLPWLWMDNDTSISVFPVLKENGVEPPDTKNNPGPPDLNNISIKVAYNKEKELMKITLDKRNFTVTDHVLSGFMINLCIHGQCYKEMLFQYQVFPEEDTIFVKYKPSKEEYENMTFKIMLCAVYDEDEDNCEKLKYQKSFPPFNFSMFLRSDPVADTNACIRDGNPQNQNSIVNMAIRLVPKAERSSLRAIFSVTRGKLCTNEFFITLTRRSECSPTPSPNNVVRYTQAYDPSLVAEFDALLPGNYCVWIYPMSMGCSSSWRCTPVMSKVVSLPVVAEPVFGPTDPPEYDPNITIITAVVAAVIIIIITIIVVIAVTLRRPRPLALLPRVIRPRPTVTEIYKEIKSHNRKEIWLSWNMVTADMKTIVETCIPLLEKCLHVKIIKKSSCESSVAILGIAAWIMKTMKEADKICFVEPDYNAEKYLNNDRYNPRSEDENIYFHSLRYASSNRDIAAKSLILRFDGLQCFRILGTTIRDKKWSIPKFLGSLFFYIHGVDGSEVEFQTFWQNDEQMNELLKLLNTQATKIHIVTSV